MMAKTSQKTEVTVLCYDVRNAVGSDCFAASIRTPECVLIANVMKCVSLPFILLQSRKKPQSFTFLDILSGTACDI